MLLLLLFALSALQPAVESRATILTQNSSCFRGWTGPDLGGSCQFKQHNWCNWTNSDAEEVDWKFIDDISRQGICMSSFGNNKNDRAWLIGPEMCEHEGVNLCVGIQYKLNKEYGGKLSLYICELGESIPHILCPGKAVWEETNWVDGVWQSVNISFVSLGRFQMILEAKKHEDWFLHIESNIYINYITYKNSSCEDYPGPSTVESLTTIRSLAGSGTTHASMITTGEEEGKSTVNVVAAVVTVLVVCVVVAIAAGVALVLIRLKTRTASEQRKASTNSGRNDSLMTVTNELYTSTGSCSGVACQNTNNIPLMTDMTVDIRRDNDPGEDNYYSDINENEDTLLDKAHWAAAQPRAEQTSTDLSDVKLATTTQDIGQTCYSNSSLELQTAENVYSNVPEWRHAEESLETEVPVDTYNHLNDPINTHEATANENYDTTSF